MSVAKILIVEDDADIRGLVKAIVERAGMTTLEAPGGTEGMRAFYDGKPDLVVLDIGLPEMDGWQVLERIRELADTPVLMLSASTTEVEKVRALRAGADDYITKPFGHQELLARIEAALRRRRDTIERAEVYRDDFIEIDFPRCQVRALGTEVSLTPTEFKLLAVFTRHPNQVLNQDHLLQLVWGEGYEESKEQVKLYVSYLRHKLREAGVDPVETVRGFGYRYAPRVLTQAQ